MTKPNLTLLSVFALLAFQIQAVLWHPARKKELIVLQMQKGAEGAIYIGDLDFK